jgi:drug/metabolite transporter (DMT)-like permease
LKKRSWAELLLILATFVWGATFVIVKGALTDASPLVFVAVRFTAAGILLLALLARGRVNARSLAPGLLLGIFLFGGYIFQTLGLTSTTPSKSAFITGFSVILVPLIATLTGTAVRPAGVAGAALGLAGLYMLVLPSGVLTVNRGDVYTLIGSLSFAVHIVLVGVYTRRHPFRQLVPVQILAVGLLALVILPFDRGRFVNWTPRLGLAVAITAVLATAFAFSVQNWAQQYTPAAHTALIFALEPVFAALTSRVVLGERLGGKMIVGGVLVLAGMLVSEEWGGSPPESIEG